MDKLLVHSRQFVIYVAGGVLCAVVDIGVMQLLLHQGVHFTAATTAGFLSGLLVNYAYHSQVTFNATATPMNFARYLCLVAINYGITLGCVALAQELAGTPLTGKILSLPVVAVVGYILGKVWIFKQGKQ